MVEKHDIEYKSIWRDEYLKWICGFANAQGGKLYIGIDDGQHIVGVPNAKSLCEDIPNKIVNNLGIVADVNLLHSQDGTEYIEIIVEPSAMPIACHGVYHYRSGATKQELKGTALQHFLLKKMGRSWDEITHETATVENIDRAAIEYFIKAAQRENRFSGISSEDSTEKILDNLHLVDDRGHLKFAALLLFTKSPMRYFPSVQFKIGRFGVSASDLLFDDVVEGNILQMADEVVRLLSSKYLISGITYEGMQRVKKPEIPEAALREMLYNAIVHKDYQSVHIQMRVYDDRIELWNPGTLPDGYTIETLLSEHSSRPRNRHIADVFFRAGFIEAWGRGIQKIHESLLAEGFPPPKLEQVQGGVLLTVMRKKMDNSGTSTPQVPPKYPLSTPQVESCVNEVLTLLQDKEMSRREMMEALGLTELKNFVNNYLKPALQLHLIELKYPDKPNHPRQKYLLAKDSQH